MAAMKLMLSVLLSVAAAVGLSDSRSEGCGVTVVLVGSNGDLAKKYLWPALYHVSGKQKIDGCKLVVFGGVRKLVADDDQMWSLVATNVPCNVEGSCSSKHSNFRQSTHFVQLGAEDDYRVLHTTIRGVYETLNITEGGRIFYLSVPPSAYPSIITSIDKHARPDKDNWMRVVLEKPFGRDLPSAEHLADVISDHLEENEVYRIDHYLGKFGVQQILPFREANKEILGDAWNKDHIERIEIVMTEELNVKGRSSFYDQYGVIRDVMQNHLTEMLAMLIMRLPQDCEDIQKAKLDALSQLYSPRLHHTHLGQYNGYHDDLYEDGVTSSPNHNESFTPTLAAVVIYSRDPLWTRVPFILISGKNLVERKSYAKVILKDRVSFNFFLTPPRACKCERHVTFLVQDREHAKPGILSSGVFNKMPSGWNGNEFTYNSNSSESDKCFEYYHYPTQDVETNAYISLMEAVIGGRREYFVATATLLESWRVWTPLLQEIDVAGSESSLPLIGYSRDNDLGELGFRLEGTKMVSYFLEGFEQLQPESILFQRHSSEWTNLLGHETVVENRFKLVSLLADEIYTLAMGAMSKEKAWHMALPGGKTPVLLYETLALDYYIQFPWQHVHVWQTDERCVDRDNGESNFRFLLNHLVSQVPIPFHHLHPLPTHLHRGACHELDKGSLLYERELKENGGLDFVLLGVGADGHIASLFPDEVVERTNDGFVQTVTLNSSYPVSSPTRMTLSYEAITSAKTIAVLIVGEQKGGLIKKVEDCMRGEYEECDVIPLVRLIRMTKKGQLFLYIDSELVS